MRPKVVLVAAMAKDRTIGKAGKIPWHYTEDMKFFKVITMATALVMGRKTFDAIGRALPGRVNIVVTHDPAAFAAAHRGVFAAGSLAAAITLAGKREARAVSVIGGGEIYAQALPLADAIILTHVPEKGGGDVFFPEFGEPEWVQTRSEKCHRVRIKRYARVR